ncbi:hypothetical protein UT300003_29340 [Clostridium sardiniense]
MIYEINSNFPGFREIPLNKGINIILAKRINNSNNSVGKSLSLECINYILGSEYGRNELSKYPDLDGYYLTLKMDMDNKVVKVKRYISNKLNNKIYIDDNKPITLKNWRKKLLKYNFNLDDYSSILTWRSLFHFFYKTDSEQNFEQALKSYKGEAKYKTSLYQSFLLNIAESEIESLAETQIITSEKRGFNKYLNTLKKSLQVIPELIKIDNNKYISINDNLNKEINNIKLDLINIQRSIDIISSKSSQLKNNMNDLLKDRKNDEISTIYNALENELGKFVKKTFDESDKFHKKIIKENLKIINNELENIEYKKSELIKDRNLKKNRLNQLLEGKLLEDERLSKIDIDDLVLNNLIKTGGKSISSKIDENIKEIEEVAPKEIEEILQNNIELIKKYREFLEEQVSKIYDSDRDVKFDLKFTDNLEVKFNYLDDSGTGKGNMKVLIYYMFIILLNKTRFNRNIDFLIFDTDITDGIDSNNLIQLFQIIEYYFQENDIQLIATLRSDRDTTLIYDKYKHWIKYILSDDEEGFLFKKGMKKIDS